MKTAFFPDRAPIDAYGNGGFRFAGMGHRGALLILPGGIYAWDIEDIEDLMLSHLDAVLNDRDRIDFLLLGTGVSQIFPSADIRAAFEKVRVGLEPMDTGAACRTYNVLLAEKRAVAAALIPV